MRYLAFLLLLLIASCSGEPETASIEAPIPSGDTVPADRAYTHTSGQHVFDSLQLRDYFPEYTADEYITKGMHLSHWHDWLGMRPEPGFDWRYLPVKSLEELFQGTRFTESDGLVMNFRGRKDAFKLDQTDQPCTNEGWYRIVPLFRLPDKGIRTNLIIGEYEQVSATNGGGWIIWMATINPKDELINLQEIGRETSYRSVNMDENDSLSLWEEHWDYVTTTMKFLPEGVESTIVNHYSIVQQKNELDTVIVLVPEMEIQTYPY